MSPDRANGCQQVSWLTHPAFAGRLGLTHCPGTWSGRPAEDVAALRRAGASVLVTLSDAAELQFTGVGDLGPLAERAGLTWIHLPISDFGVPDAEFEEHWQVVGPMLHAWLAQGADVVVHCYAGLGRTGVVCARLLVEFGEEPERAIRLVREVRPGALQNAAQEAYVLGLRLADAA